MLRGDEAAGPGVCAIHRIRILPVEGGNGFEPLLEKNVYRCRACAYGEGGNYRGLPRSVLKRGAKL